MVAGSRSINDFDISDYVSKDTALIISCGASGIDELAEKYADKHKISKLVLRPQYKIYGRGAPLKRNEMMVDLADTVLLVWDKKSKGTKYTLAYAKRKGKTIILVEI